MSETSRISSALSSLTEQLGALTQRLSQLEARIATLEDRVGVHGDASIRSPAGARPLGDDALPTARTHGGHGTLPLIGQLFLTLGGAFLLRALTEGGLLPGLAGTLLALAYAVAWFALADRAAARHQGAAATLRSLAAALIAYPLLFEATARFGYLSPAISALALGAITGIGLLLAWRRHLHGAAWIIVLCAVPTTAALAFASRAFVPYLSCLLLIGLATLWLGYLRRWSTIAPSTALVIDFILLLTTVLFVSQPPVEMLDQLGASSLITLLLSLVVVYLGSIAGRTLFRERNVTVPEIVQTTAVLLIGLGGATVVEQSRGAPSMRFGVVALLVAAACYVVSFMSIDRRLGRGRNFLFYTTLGLVLTIFALVVMLDGRLLTMALSVAAILAAGLGARYQRATLGLHGAVYVAVSAVTSGTLSSAASAFVGSPLAPPDWITLSVLLTLLAAAVNAWLRVMTGAPSWQTLSRSTQLVTLIILAVGVGGAVVALLAPLLPLRNGAAPHPGAVAALRTGVLALLAVLLAWAGNRQRLQAGGWLVYPLLILGGVKFLIEDIQQGRASTLVASFVLYGLALIIAPRLIRRAKTAVTALSGS
jgi:hypothetical protein